MKNIYQTFIFLILLSCSDKSEHDEQNLPLINQAIINEDSCNNWKLPLVSLKLNYPGEYRLTYNSEDQKDNYLRLQKFTDKRVIIQEISIGKGSQYSSEEIKSWIYRMDTMLMNLRSYKSTFIGFKSVADKERFILQGTVNFDLFRRSEYRGDYNILLTLIPSDKGLNGISFSFMSKLSADSLLNDKDLKCILNSLNFDK